MVNEKLVAAIVVVVFVAVIGYFIIGAGRGSTEIPVYVTGETKEVYEWAKTAEGAAILEQIPCYCGCKYEGHLHTRHCFWRDDGTFDKHGITCSVCLDIGRRAMQMTIEEGQDICAIRDEIDAFYEPNAQLGTETPYPEECK